MKMPLPAALQIAEYSTTANTGLWYDKFCNKWNKADNGEWKLDAPAKQEWMNTVTAKPCGDRELLAEHHTRIAMLTKQLGGGYRVFSNVYRFVSGLGREHPVENGFAWHHTLGTPFLPGSSVKGTLRAFLTTWTDMTEAEINGIFGPKENRMQQAVGSVVFLDAIPVVSPTLKADVMTPHYDPYYQKDEIPGDWHSPIPIPFLTVAPNAKFLFAVLPHTGGASDKTDCEKILNRLGEALQTAGAGAKTATGYGRFTRDVSSEAEIKKREEAIAKEAAFAASLASLGSLTREFAQAANKHQWETDGNAFKESGVVEGWLDKIEADPQPDVIACLRKLLDKHFPDLLADPDKMKGKKKDQPFFKDRWRAIAKRFNALLKSC